VLKLQLALGQGRIGLGRLPLVHLAIDKWVWTKTDEEHGKRGGTHDDTDLVTSSDGRGSWPETGIISFYTFKLCSFFCTANVACSVSYASRKIVETSR
jgi:hypothetical protein